LDVVHHSTASGSFTLITGNEVFGSSLVVIKGLDVWGFIFWCVAFFLWAVLMYTFFTIIIIKKVKPVIEEAVNGGWLLAVVSTQSIAVLGTLVASGMGAYSDI